MPENVRPATVDLEQLDLGKLKDAVDGLWNLSYHRILVLEGIRKIAFRNIEHLEDVKKRCELAHTHSNNDDWIACLQGTMLADQGLEERKAARYLIEWATFYPIQVCLALLYAEIEYFQKTCISSDFLSDDVLSAYIDGKAEWVSSLSDVERAYCISGFMAHYDLNFVECIQDMDVGEFLATSFEQMSTSLPEPEYWKPTPRQRSKALVLISCLGDVCFSAFLAPDVTHEAPRQPPMALATLFPMILGRASSSYRDSRHAAHVIRNMIWFRRLVLTAGVLLNEGIMVYDRERLPEHYTQAQLEEIIRASAEEISSAALDREPVSRYGVQYAMHVGALGRVVAAILYESLRIYAEVVEESSEGRRDTLEEWITSNKLKTLRNYRNAVFYVVNNPQKVSLVVKDKQMFSHIYDLYEGLAEFFGWGQEVTLSVE